jgi:hypothetical protein
MMLLENFTVSFATVLVLSSPQLSVVLQVASPKSTKRYSILAVRLSVNAAESGLTLKAIVYAGRDIAESGAAGAVEQDPVCRIAEPRASRGDEKALSVALPAAKAHIGTERIRTSAMDPRAVKIGFCAIDESVGLEIDAHGRADHKTGQAEVTSGAVSRMVVWIGPIAGAEAIARIGAEIKSAPVVDLGNDSGT